MIIIIIILFLILYRNNKINKRVFYSTNEFKITKILEKNWKIIADECKRLPINKFVTKEGRKQASWHKCKEFEKLVELHKNEYGWINGWQVNQNSVNDKWINWGLMYDGKLLGINSKLCPKTSELLSSIPKIRVAGFSLMFPESNILPHTDSTGIEYGSLAYHLGLDVPTDKESILYVGKNKMKEENGKAFLFDATNMHYAINNSKYMRAILYIDFDLDGIKVNNFVCSF